MSVLFTIFILRSTVMEMQSMQFDYCSNSLVCIVYFITVLRYIVRLGLQKVLSQQVSTSKLTVPSSY